MIPQITSQRNMVQKSTRATNLVDQPTTPLARLASLVKQPNNQTTNQTSKQLYHQKLQSPFPLTRKHNPDRPNFWHRESHRSNSTFLVPSIAKHVSYFSTPSKTPPYCQANFVREVEHTASSCALMLSLLLVAVR